MSQAVTPAFAEEPLEATEIRVLGSLIEKQLTTPESYPLTLNALVLACNQKTSREPVLNLTPGEVGQGLRRLEERGLARLVMGSRGRIAGNSGWTGPWNSLHPSGCSAPCCSCAGPRPWANCWPAAAGCTPSMILSRCATIWSG